MGLKEFRLTGFFPSKVSEKEENEK